MSKIFQSEFFRDQTCRTCRGTKMSTPPQNSPRNDPTSLSARYWTGVVKFTAHKLLVNASEQNTLFPLSSSVLSEFRGSETNGFTRDSAVTGFSKTLKTAGAPTPREPPTSGFTADSAPARTSLFKTPNVPYKP